MDRNRVRHTDRTGNLGHAVVPGEQACVDIVARLAQEVIDLDAALKEIDATI